MKLTLSAAWQRAIAIALFVTAIGIFLFLVVLPFWQGVTLHEQRIAMLREQAAKLEALAAATPEFEKAAQAIVADPRMDALAFAGTQPGVGEADLQSTLNRIFSSAGATVMSGQAVPVEGGNRIAVQTTVEANIATLVRALHAIGTARPILRIETLAIKEPDGEWTNPSAARGVANKLIVDLTVSAQMQRP